jgi:hypothetical protein
MSSREFAYRFAEDLPIGRAPPGTNVLVAGPAMDGGRTLVVRLAMPATTSEGAVFVSADSGCSQLMRHYTDEYGDWARDRTAFVDCVTPEGEVEDVGVSVETVASPGDLTGIGMAYSALVERLAADGVPRVRIGVVSVNSLLMYSDLETVYRFGHTVAGRVQATDGLGVFFVDPSTQEAEAVNTLTQFFDARVDVRRADGTRELRCRGILDGPEEWTTF